MWRLGFVAKKAMALPRPAKRALVLFLDVGLCVLTVWLAFFLRLDDSWVYWQRGLVLTTVVSVALAIPIFIVSGMHRAIFRFSGAAALASMVRALSIYGVIFAAVFGLYGIRDVPRGIGLIQPLLLILFAVGSRVFVRAWLNASDRSKVRKSLLPRAFIYGAGSAGRQLASAMGNSRVMRVVGFLDDEPHLHGHMLNGLPIHNPVDLADAVSKAAVTHVLLALPSVSRQRRQQIIETLKAHQLAVRTLPDLSDIATGKVRLSDVRELDVDDLLGREPVKPNEQLLHKNTRDKTVLVTGAGGSIGSELCRQIAKTGPKRLLLLELSEYALYQIHQELQAFAATQTAQIDLVPLLGSVCDAARMQAIMQTWRPQTVYHAAAYKHVPLVEHNPAQGVFNNVWGTYVSALAARDSGVDNFVLVSTDKAVRPTNVMGASKRLAEMILQALAADVAAPKHSSDQSHRFTCFMMVRFGNVLGSSGSVVPLFRSQIENGGPITLTDPNITRYFMTIPEAAQLVIQACAMGVGGDVFVLDMGQSVKIMDLAQRMVALSGLTLKSAAQPDGDIEITITGLRPGEKLYEELLIGENPEHTEHPRIMKAREPFMPLDHLDAQLQHLLAAVNANDVDAIYDVLKTLVKEYQAQETPVDWVYVASRQVQNSNSASL
jgi:FlaA1/EpsC-like NDP-sugar epimerase